jgi:hypothetical protein
MKTLTILLILAFTSRVMAQVTYGPVTPLSPEIIDPANGYTYDNIYTINTVSPTLVAFNYIGVNQIIFIGSGGTPH